MFVVMLPAPVQKALAWINHALMLFVSVMILVFGWQVMAGTFGQTFGALEISPATFYSAAPYCGALMIVFWIEKTFDPASRVPSGEVHL